MLPGQSNRHIKEIGERLLKESQKRAQIKALPVVGSKCCKEVTLVKN